MKTKCIGTSTSKEGLQNLINKYFYSENWIITDNNEAYNTKLNKFLDNHIIKVSKGRWQLRQIERS